MIIRLWIFSNSLGLNHGKGSAAEQLRPPCGRQSLYPLDGCEFMSPDGPGKWHRDCAGIGTSLGQQLRLSSELRMVHANQTSICSLCPPAKSMASLRRIHLHVVGVNHGDEDLRVGREGLRNRSDSFPLRRLGVATLACVCMCVCVPHCPSGPYCPSCRIHCKGYYSCTDNAACHNCKVNASCCGGSTNGGLPSPPGDEAFPDSRCLYTAFPFALCSIAIMAARLLTAAR